MAGSGGIFDGAPEQLAQGIAHVIRHLWGRRELRVWRSGRPRVPVPALAFREQLQWPWARQRPERSSAVPGCTRRSRACCRLHLRRPVRTIRSDLGSQQGDRRRRIAGGPPEGPPSSASCTCILLLLLLRRCRVSKDCSSTTLTCLTT